MNIVTTNTTGVVMPYNTTYICNPKSYRYNYGSDISDVASYDFLKSSDEDRRKAVEKIYKRGYITRDEANSLVSERYAKRNDCTTIFCVDEITEIVIFCTESESFLHSETLFKFSYDKVSGNVTEDIN